MSTDLKQVIKEIKIDEVIKVVKVIKVLKVLKTDYLQSPLMFPNKYRM